MTVQDTEVHTDVPQIGDNARSQLRSIVERIEHLEEEKKAIAEDVRGCYQEAKGNGFDPKALRALIRRRAQDKAELDEFEAVLQTYMEALGMS